MSGCFAEWQPLYAARRVATFPVSADKRPCIRSYDKVGLSGSAQLAIKFSDADAFGFVCGRRSGVTAVDVDTRDELALDEAKRIFGDTPIVCRTGSGNFAMWFRHSGEGRRIRGIPGLPIDVLGAGFVVAPPSLGSQGRRYEFLEGTLADLDRLPRLRGVDMLEPAEASRPGRIPGGRRNNSLFHFALEQAPHVDNFDGLLDVVRTRNMDCVVPLGDAELAKAATSAWRIEQEGRNLVGRGQAMVMANAAFDALIAVGPDAWVLYCHLRRNHWGRDFVLANAMAASLGWNGGRGINRFRTARAALVTLGFIVCKHPGGNGPHDPPVYGWRAG